MVVERIGVRMSKDFVVLLWKQFWPQVTTGRVSGSRWRVGGCRLYLEDWCLLSILNVSQRPICYKLGLQPGCYWEMSWQWSGGGVCALEGDIETLTPSSLSLLPSRHEVSCFALPNAPAMMPCLHHSPKHNAWNAFRPWTETSDIVSHNKSFKVDYLTHFVTVRESW